MMDEHGRIADFVLVVDSKRMMPNLLGLAGWIHTSVKRNLEWGSVINIDCKCCSPPLYLLSSTLPSLLSYLSRTPTNIPSSSPFLVTTSPASNPTAQTA